MSLPFKVVSPSFEHGLVLLATLIRGRGGITSTSSLTGHFRFMTKYSTVSQILLQLVVATLHWIAQFIAGSYFLSNWAWNRSITSSWNQNSWRHTTCRLGVWLAMRSTIARNLGTYKLGLELSHWPQHPLKYNEIITLFH